jgi:hypothetical protein
MGPMNYLAKNSNDEIQIICKLTSQGLSWTDIMGVDMVFLHRPCRQDDLVIMQIAYNCGVPTWVDYDDWLFDLPGWNPNAGYYHATSTQNIVAQCLSCADVVSCSTEALAQSLRLVNDNVVILPNAYRSDLFTYRKKEIEPRQPIVYWRGSNTHDGDLLSVKEGFKNINAVTHFIGGASWLLLASMDEKKYKIQGSQDFLIFNRFIYDLRPKVMVFPLVDCYFNRCKSNIAYIEAIHSGALCVAPDMPEWRKAGVVTYKAHDSLNFQETVNNILEWPDTQYKNFLIESFDSMKQEYDIKIINEKRKAVVKKLENKLNPRSPFDQPLGMNALALLKNRNKPIENNLSDQQAHL